MIICGLMGGFLLSAPPLMGGSPKSVHVVPLPLRGLVLKGIPNDSVVLASTAPVSSATHVSDMLDWSSCAESASLVHVHLPRLRPTY